MSDIIRRPDFVGGGITEEEKKALDKHTEKWTKNAFQTGETSKVELTRAIKDLYRVSNLKEPRVIIVPSPLVMAFAGMLSVNWWEFKKPGRSGVATRAATRAATYAATDAATRAATEAATRAATEAATRAATRAATYAATDAATRVATRAATYAATGAATDAAIDAATYAATDAATRAATYAATDAATRAATYAATDAATYAATRAATDAATYAATDAATEAATYAATGAATRAATRAATYAATDAATRAAICNSWLFNYARELFGDFAKDAMMSLPKWYEYYQGGNMWSAWTCYLTAFRDVLGLQLPIYEKFEAWERAAMYGGFRFMHSEFCMVSEFPLELRINNQNQPHCETGPSHLWRDGWALYHLDGVRLEKEIYQSIMSKEMSLADVLKIENADQQAVALKYNPDAIIKDGAKLIDVGAERIYTSQPIFEHEDSCHTVVDGEAVLKPRCCKPVGRSKRIVARNELYLVEGSPFNDLVEYPKAYFVKMTCPTGRTFIEGVEPEFAASHPKADECQAWLCGITSETYRNLSIEG